MKLKTEVDGDPLLRSTKILKMSLEKAKNSAQARLAIELWPAGNYLYDHVSPNYVKFRFKENREVLMESMYKLLIQTCLEYRVCWTALPKYVTCKERWRKQIRDLVKELSK